MESLETLTGGAFRLALETLGRLAGQPSAFPLYYSSFGIYYPFAVFANHCKKFAQNHRLFIKFEETRQVFVCSCEIINLTKSFVIATVNKVERELMKCQNGR